MAEKVKACLVCSREFGVFRWRYDCGVCGKVVCDDCRKATETPNGLREGNFAKVAACTPCFEAIQKEIFDNPALQAQRLAHRRGHEEGYKEGYDDGYRRGVEDGESAERRRH